MQASGGAARAEDGQFSAPRLPLSVRDFELLGVLGDGSLATVFHARRRATGEEVALKVVDKAYVQRHRLVEAIVRERTIMDALRSPLVVSLRFTFQDSAKVFMALELLRNGDLFEQLRWRRPLPAAEIRFYAAEMVLILEFLRARSVLFRDFKPENLLLDDAGHLKLTDFGCAKYWVPKEASERGPTSSLPDAAADGSAAAAAAAAAQKREVSFVGTADYVSPEVLNSEPVSPACDLWGLGCVIYQMIEGTPPFRDVSEYLIMQRVAVRDLRFPPAFPADARDLVDRLLALRPDERLGAADFGELKAHPFFAAVEWASLRGAEAPVCAPPDRSAMRGADLWDMHALGASLPTAGGDDDGSDNERP